MADPKDKSESDPFSDSSELFDSLFKDAPLEDEKKPRRPAGVSQGVKRDQELKRKGQAGAKPARPKQKAPPVRPAMKGPGDAVPPGRRLDFSNTGRRRGVTPPPAPRTPRPKERTEKRTTSRSKGRKGSRILKLALLVLLLVAGSAAAASYLGFVDIGRYIGSFTGDQPSAVPQEVVRIRPEKKTAEQIPVEPVIGKPKPQPTPPAPEAPPRETKAPALVSPQEGSSSGNKPTGTEGPEAVSVPHLSPRPAIPSEAVQPPPQARPVQENLAKTAPSSKAPPLPRELHARYPFSVYLGAFMTLDRARTAVSIYQEDYDISSYWVKVDLGEKGLWYRIFTGHFRTEQEAEAFVRQKELKDGQVKQTKFSTLIGEYSKPAEAEETVRGLLQRGYSSYFVPVSGGGVRLYSGAFYTLTGAKKQHAELASKGIHSRVVER